MKTTIIAATLAMLAGAPLVATAAPSVHATNATTTEHTKTQLPAAHTHTHEASTQPEFVGPFELHNGLLPNGLAPNPFNYG